MAVTMAGIVAYVSVGGLMKVFSGAGFLGLLFFSAIEVAKIIATSAMHTYGKKIGIIYKILLSIGITITMVITSVGIYGFLSSTYKESFIKLEGVEAQVTLLEKKRDGIQSQLNGIDKEMTSINTRVSELSSGLSNNVIQYKDKETGQIITTTSSSTRRVLERQLDKAIERQSKLNIKSDDLNSKIFDLDNEILEVKVGNDTAAELGPLKYLSEVTGKSMDEVMKYFIFLLILIGDPMAVLMVIVFNKVVKKSSEDKKPISEPEPKGNIYDTDGTITTERMVTQPKEEPSSITTEIVPPISTEPPSGEGLKSYMDIIEEPKEETKTEEVKEEPTPTQPERGFSVNIPKRKNTNTVNRIGSNKETRNGDDSAVYFKRR